MKAKLTFFSLALSLLVLIGLGFAVINRQSIYDWSRLRNYTPPTEIALLANETTMNDNGKRLFYLNWPDLQDKQEFNQNCTESEESIVLGCYINGKGIFLYDVQEARLEGVEEVTAAHEMLHSAYDRLSSKERKEVDVLTETEFNKLTNERIIKTVEAYRKKDPLVVPNELHSIIATEVRDISAELENYYKKYFINRQKIVEISEKYEGEFTKLENRAEELKTTLNRLKTEIDSTNASLEKEAKNLAEEYRQLESNRYQADAEEFNAQASEYNQKVATYNQQVKLVSIKIDEYNSAVNEYNGTITLESELYNAIDSRPEAIKSE